MNEQDKINFKQMMNTVTTLYQKPHLDIDTLRVWFAKFQSYEFDQVTKAFDKWVTQSKFMPTPADIFTLIKEKKIEFARLEQPKLSKQANALYAANVNKYVQDIMPKEKNLKYYRAWAHRIIANPKNYPAISLEFAKQALNAN